MIASAQTSSFIPAGRIRFVEDHENPPSRAYLKVQESLTIANSFLGEGNFNIPHFLGILKAKKPFINVLLEASTPENVKASCDYIRGCYELA